MLCIFLKTIFIVNSFWEVFQTKCKFIKKTTLTWCVLFQDFFEVLTLSFSHFILLILQIPARFVMKLSKNGSTLKFFVLHLIVTEMNLVCAKFHISSCLQSKVVIWTYFFPNSPKTRARLWHHQQTAFLFLDFYFNGPLCYGSILCKKSVLMKF